MFSTLFWKDAGERAVKTFAQYLLATVTVAGVVAGGLNWHAVLVGAVTAAGLSLLTSVLSANVPGGSGVSASLVRTARPGKHESAHPTTPEV